MDSHCVESNADSGSDRTSHPPSTRYLFRTIYLSRACTRVLTGRRLASLLAFAILALPLAVAFADPGTRPPRPTIAGRVGQGSAPCSATPSDLATLRITLLKDDGSGVCDSGDTAVYDAFVVPDSSGAYVIPAATGEPGWQGAWSYCIGVTRVSLATPEPYGVVEPGTDDATSYAVDDICVP
jgi:hypothetical protein